MAQHLAAIRGVRKLACNPVTGSITVEYAPELQLNALLGELQEAGKRVVAENIAGAGGMVGGSRVAKAPPNGYQFVIGNVGTFAQSQWLYKAPLYNAISDFAPVALLTDEALVLLARNDFPADNLQQFISYANANQGKLQYSSSGAGGSNHLACMLLNSTIGIEATHVPYRNVVQALQEVMAGRMDYDCVSLPLALPQIAGKTVKPIAILSKNRSSNLPDLPSAHEQGLTKFDLPSWYALFLPAKTPQPIIQMTAPRSQRGAAPMAMWICKKGMLADAGRLKTDHLQGANKWASATFA